MAETPPVEVVGRCPVCATACVEDARIPSVRCPVCDTPHHPECWEYLGGCAIFACSPRSEAARSLSSSSLPSSPPPDFIPLANELAGFIRRQSDGLGLIARGLALAFIGSPLVAIIVSGLLRAWGVRGSDDYLALLLFGLLLMGLALALVGVLVLAQGTLARWAAVQRLSTHLDVPLRLGGPGRSRIVERLDLSRLEHQSTRNAGAAGRLGLVFFAYWAAGSTLLDLQVTLNRIEAAGKGKG